jgi:hypothetical protein
MPPHLSEGAKTQNLHNVQLRQWRKWNQQSRFIFNYVYGQLGDQRVVKHPKAEEQFQDHWDTIRWNAAWLAADAAWESVRGGKQRTTLLAATDQVFVPMLKALYAKAGIAIPKEIDPHKEAARLARALKGKL